MLPKNKIYEHSGANARLKDLFVEQVEQIIWQYKLAPETINLPARPGVPEIQIFSIQLKGSELQEDVLRCIDGAVQFPILFELNRGQGDQAKTQVVAAYKRPSEADASRWVLSSYFATDWMPAGTARTSLPLALDMAHLCVFRPIVTAHSEKGVTGDSEVVTGDSDLIVTDSGRRRNHRSRCRNRRSRSNRNGLCGQRGNHPCHGYPRALCAERRDAGGADCHAQHQGAVTAQVRLRALA